MTIPTHIPTIDSRSDLGAAVYQLVLRELRSHQISYIWPEQHRILFRTADNRTGDVEVFVNWCVTRVTQKGAQDGAGEIYSAQVSTESGGQP